MFELRGFKKNYIYDVKSSKDESNLCVYYYIEFEFYL